MTFIKFCSISKQPIFFKQFGRVPVLNLRTVFKFSFLQPLGCFVFTFYYNSATIIKRVVKNTHSRSKVHSPNIRYTGSIFRVKQKKYKSSDSTKPFTKQKKALFATFLCMSPV